LVANTTVRGTAGIELLGLVSNVSARAEDGTPLAVSASTTTVHATDWALGWMVKSVSYDLLTISPRAATAVILDYDIMSSEELWAAFGAGPDTFYGADHPKDFWAGYLEWLLYRPLQHAAVGSARLSVQLPTGWRFATSYPRQESVIALGTLDYMYSDNPLRWMNLQKGFLVLFREGPFRLMSSIVSGVEVQDVCSVQLNRRNQEAQWEYFRYMSEYIGPLPATGVLTFALQFSSDSMKYFDAYQGAPYASRHALLGEFFSGTGGDIGRGGNYLSVPQRWALNSYDETESYCFHNTGTFRYWFMNLLQMDTGREQWLKGGLTMYYQAMAVASRYGSSCILDRWLKPMYAHYCSQIVRGTSEVDQVNFNGHSFIEYFKYCLVFFHFDSLIREYSHGEKCLDDAMRALYQDAIAGLPMTQTRLVAALNSVGVYDFTQAVADYLYGDKVLDLGASLQVPPGEACVSPPPPESLGQSGQATGTTAAGSIEWEGTLRSGAACTLTITVRSKDFVIQRAGKPTARFLVASRDSSCWGRVIQGIPGTTTWQWTTKLFEEAQVPLEPSGDIWVGKVTIVPCAGVYQLLVSKPPVQDAEFFAVDVVVLPS
jgi:hypothetical protein